VSTLPGVKHEENGMVETVLKTPDSLRLMNDNDN